MSPMLMAVALIGAHFLADFAGQGDFMAKAKNPATPIPGVPWRTVLGAHVAIHGAVVALITGVWWLALFEAAAHWEIDRRKCRGALSFNQDQALHIACKALWLSVAIGVNQ